MDAPVGNQLLQGQPGDFAPDRVEAGHNHSIGRVVDDDVHPRGQLERADVASLAPDDPPFHFIVRQGNRRNGGFGCLLRGNPLNGERDDLLRLAIGISFCRFTNITNAVCGIGLGFISQALNELGLRLLG